MSRPHSSRARFTWKLRTRSLELGQRTVVMGVINVTPDSFSDGGQFEDTKGAVQHGLLLLDEGADILDIGGESTRPGAKTAGDDLGLAGAVSAEEECRRVLPVVYGILAARPTAVISVDTYKAEVARRAVQAGVEIVNDVSALSWDPAMAATLATSDCGVILMHTRGRPADWRSLPREPKIVDVVKKELAERLAAAEKAGIARERIVLDPGFGFGKNFSENFPMLARFAEFSQLGCPLLAGTSRKSFLGQVVSARIAELTGKPPAESSPRARLSPSVASAAIAVLAGAHIVRAHDVRATVEAVAIADAVLEAG